MADSADRDSLKKKMPQALPVYKEATDLAIDDFQNLSVCKAIVEQDLYGDSSESADLNQLGAIDLGGFIGMEDDDTSANGIEVDMSANGSADSVKMQMLRVDDPNMDIMCPDICADGIEDDDSSADGIEDDDSRADGIEDDGLRADSVLHLPNMELMNPDLTWEQMVMAVLHMIRCREFTEYNHKLQISVPTRFCLFNIALFNLDEESKIEPRPLFRDIPPSDYWKMENSVNVISIKVAVSDIGYPINIFGTVLARDQVDYRCVYLFNRGRDNPQLITSPVDTLTLTGPDRALAVTDDMFFEFNLKVADNGAVGKGDNGAVDKDFCKGLLEHNTARHTLKTMTLTLESWLSTVKMVFTVVPFAVEASLAVSILKGPANFIGKIVAWTTGNDENEIILYDSGVAGTQTKLGTNGFVALTRSIVAVPQNEHLVLNVTLPANDHKSECLMFIIGNDVEKCTNTIGPYELQVEIVWRGVIKQRRPNMWEYFGDLSVLR